MKNEWFEIVCNDDEFEIQPLRSLTDLTPEKQWEAILAKWDLIVEFDDDTPDIDLLSGGSYRTCAFCTAYRDNSRSYPEWCVGCPIADAGYGKCLNEEYIIAWVKDNDPRPERQFLQDLYCQWLNTRADGNYAALDLEKQLSSKESRNTTPFPDLGPEEQWHLEGLLLSATADALDLAFRAEHLEDDDAIARARARVQSLRAVLHWVKEQYAGKETVL